MNSVGRRENLMDDFSQNFVKGVIYIVTIYKVVFMELALMVATETSCCDEEFQNSMQYFCTDHLLDHGNWGQRRIYMFLVMGLFMLMGVVRSLHSSRILPYRAFHQSCIWVMSLQKENRRKDSRFLMLLSI
jgi:hypothetical protein